MMTRFWAYLSLVSVAVACGGTAYTTADSQGTGGGNASGGVTTGSGGSNGTGGGNATGGVTNGSTSLHASDFDQSCEWDSQCSVVFEGSVCGCNLCPNAAINYVDLQAYEAAKASIVCAERELLCLGEPCQGLVGSCQSGTCSARPSVIIDESTLGTSCSDDDQCVAIPSGEICSECRCGQVAVNLSGKEQYEQLVANAKCNPGPVACDCAFLPRTPYCDTSMGSGVCRLEEATP